MKKIILTILWAIFTFVVPVVLILMEFIVENTWQYRVSVVAFFFIIALITTLKTMFVRGYQDRINELQLNVAIAPENDKKPAEAKLRRHMAIMHCINAVDTTLPLLILMIATSFLGTWLGQISGLIGFIWLSIMVGAGLNIWKKVGAK